MIPRQVIPATLPQERIPGNGQPAGIPLVETTRARINPQFVMGFVDAITLTYPIELDRRIRRLLFVHDGGVLPGNLTFAWSNSGTIDGLVRIGEELELPDVHLETPILIIGQDPPGGGQLNFRFWAW